MFYFPYQGRDYKRGYRDGTKLLILGESFYDQVEDRNGPTSVLESHVCKKPIGPFFTDIERIVTGKNKKLDGDERSAFWSRVAFTNVIQEPLEKPGVSPTPAQWQRARKAFVGIIKQTQPDLVFVFSRRAFCQIPDSQEFPGSRDVDPDDTADSPYGPSKDEAYLYKVDYRPADRWLLAGRFNHPAHPVVTYEKWHKWAETLFKLAPKFK